MDIRIEINNADDIKIAEEIRKHPKSCEKGVFCDSCPFRFFDCDELKNYRKRIDVSNNKIILTRHTEEIE